MVACVTDIQRFSLHDGPGVRTTVFFKGCPLECAWCHNPETINPDPEFIIDRDGKSRLVGRYVSVDDVFSEILKDLHYYEGSNGGVTFSGGEPAWQIPFIEAVAEACRRKRIHVAVDTSCMCSEESMERLIRLADLLLVDLKLVDPELHRRFTGQANTTILSNIRRISSSSVRYYLRIPLVHGVNDSPTSLKDFRGFIESLDRNTPELVEILPYHSLGEGKWDSLGRTRRLEENPAVSQESIDLLSSELQSIGMQVRVSFH